MHSALTSASSFHMRCIRELESYPWSFCSGDVEGKLQGLALHEESPGTDLVTHKIWDLIRNVQWPLHKIKQGIAKLAECRWSTAIIEQCHGSGAVIHKAHKEYAADMLAVRATIHMVRALFTQPNAHEDSQGRARFEGALEKEYAKHSKGRVTGRHIFLGDMLEASWSKGEPESHMAKICDLHAQVLSLWMRRHR